MFGKGTCSPCLRLLRERESGIPRQARDDGRKLEETWPESVAGGSADPERTFARPPNANGARNCFRASLSPAGARSIWRLPFRLGGGQVPSSVPRPRHRCPFCEASRLPIVALARFDRSFAATFPVVQKDRQSSTAPLHRRPAPFLAIQGRLRSHPPGAEPWRWPKPKLEPLPPLRVPGGRIRTAASPVLPASSRFGRGRFRRVAVRTAPQQPFRLPFSPHSKPVFPRSEDRVRSDGAP